MRWLDTKTVPPRVGEVAQVVAQPADAVGVEAVGRLVEQEHLRVAEQRGGQSEALAHAEREAAGPLVGCRFEPDFGQDLVDAVGGDAAVGRDGPKVVAGGAARVHAPGVENRADDVRRGPQSA